MKRREFTLKTKRAGFDRCKGFCELCDTYLLPGTEQYDHITPAGLGGSNQLDNLQVLCWPCHSDKTHRKGGDRSKMYKADRQKKAHEGTKKRKGRPIPGSRDHYLKKKIDGTVERR